MKKIYLIILMLIMITSTVQANQMNSIDMDIFIDENGKASVTETWEFYSDSGTECYHPYAYLGASEIENVRVSDETHTYEVIDDWDVNASFDEKKYKCGINQTPDGAEICFGISEYGAKTYVVKYDITNFVSELADSQMVYWTLIPQDVAPKKASIKIHSNFDYEDTLPVWGYGNYGGYCYVANGVIEMIASDALNSSEYMTILVKFPSGTFKCQNKIDENFEHYYNLSVENSQKYEEGGIIETLCGIFTVAFISFFSFLGISACMQEAVKVTKEDKKNVKEAPFYRDIPCQGDISRAFYISTVYKLTKKDGDFLGAMLLKWLKEDLIAIKLDEKGKKKEIVLKSDTESIENAKEKELYNMMKIASKDGILSQGEFEKWCSRKYEKLFDWFESVKKEEKATLVTEGKIVKIKKRGYKAEEGLTKEAMELSGLKRFLKEYTLIKEREPLEVKMFEEYLIYAQIFGIAKEVQKAFKNLYPEIVAESCYNTYDDLAFLYIYANSGVESAARAHADAYTSGGGGFSSGGGGGGSFGGGSGCSR